MIESPLVSVVVVTYNHVNYIEMCLKSILTQKTTFSFEIILGEDDSTDGTKEICIKYASQFPKIIKLFLRKRNDVIYINEKPTGRFNIIESLKVAKGKYIALCDGDDYWLDNNKLQKQIEFLEKNTSYVMCFHNASILHQKKNKIIGNILSTKISEKTFNTSHLFHSPFIPSASVVFRNLKNFHLPNWVIKTPSFDMAVFTLLTKYGKIKYLDKIMSIYRVHPQGVSRTHNGLFLLRSRIFLFENLNNHFNNYYIEEHEKEVKKLIWKYILSNQKEIIKQFIKYYLILMKNKFLFIRKTNAWHNELPQE